MQPGPDKRVLPPWMQFMYTMPSPLTITSAVTLHDSNTRLKSYIYPLQRIGEEMLRQYKSGTLGPHDVVTHSFVKLRNELMLNTRSLITPGALAMSEYLKQNPLTESDLRLKYSRQLKMSPFSKEVSEAVMQAAIRTNPVVTNQAIRSRFFGITGLALAPGILTFRIYNAKDEDRVYEMFRFGSELTGGTIAIWRGVPAMWGACKIVIPKMLPKYVVAMHVVFNLTMSSMGSVLGGEAYDRLRT